MQVIYEASAYPRREDFDNEVDARAFIEAAGSGRVVKFVRGFDGKDRSCAMGVYNDGAWKGVDISR